MNSRRQRRTAVYVALAVLSASLLGPAISVAQEVGGGGQDETTTLEEIIVEGRPLREAATRFVGSVAAPGGVRPRALARWHRRVCIGVINLQPSIAQLMIDRISAVAGEIGLEPGSPGCRPGLLVIMVADGDVAAQEVVAARPTQFSTRIAESTASRTALNRFLTSGRAIRWWHISQPVDPETGVPSERVPGEMPRDSDIPGQTIGRTTTPFAATRLRSATRSDLRQVIVIVDVDILATLPLHAVTDYVAMVGLAQIDPEAQTAGFDTILNLLNAPVGNSPALTDWDRAYLHGLYGTEQDGVNIGSNLSDVVNGMFRELRERPAE